MSCTISGYLKAGVVAAYATLANSVYTIRDAILHAQFDRISHSLLQVSCCIVLNMVLNMILLIHHCHWLTMIECCLLLVCPGWVLLATLQPHCIWWAHVGNIDHSIPICHRAVRRHICDTNKYLDEHYWACLANCDWVHCQYQGMRVAAVACWVINISNTACCCLSLVQATPHPRCWWPYSSSRQPESPTVPSWPDSHNCPVSTSHCQRGQLSSFSNHNLSQLLTTCKLVLNFQCCCC